MRAVRFQFALDARAILAKLLNLKLYGLAAQQISVFYAISQIGFRSAENFDGVSELIEQVSAGFANRTHGNGLVGISFILRH